MSEIYPPKQQITINFGHLDSGVGICRLCDRICHRYNMSVFTNICCVDNKTDKMICFDCLENLKQTLNSSEWEIFREDVSNGKKN